MSSRLTNQHSSLEAPATNDMPMPNSTFVVDTAATQQLTEDASMGMDGTKQALAPPMKRKWHSHGNVQYMETELRKRSVLLNGAEATAPFDAANTSNLSPKKRKVGNKENQEAVTCTGGHSTKCTLFGGTSTGNNANFGMSSKYMSLNTLEGRTHERNNNSTLMASPPPLPVANVPTIFNINTETISSGEFPAFATSPAIPRAVNNGTVSKHAKRSSLPTLNNRKGDNFPIILIPSGRIITQVKSGTDLLPDSGVASLTPTQDTSGCGKTTHASKPNKLNQPTEQRRRFTKSTFLAQAPYDKQQWDELRTKSKVDTPEIIFGIFETLVVRDRYSEASFGHPVRCHAHEKPVMVHTCSKLLREYQEFRQSLDSQPGIEAPISRFRDLIFLCLCLVSDKQGLCEGELEKAILAYWPGRENKPQYWSRLRTAAKQMAHAIEEVEDKVGYRGSQLFLMSNLPMEKYRMISESADTTSNFSTELTSKLRSMGAEPAEYDISFSPAFLIACMDVKLDHINNALGTKLTPRMISLRRQKVRDAERTLTHHGKEPRKQHVRGHDEKSLLSLICAMETVPRFMLEQASLPQKRWTESGGEKQILPRDMELDEQLKDLILKPRSLWQVLERLISVFRVGVEKFNDMDTYIGGRTLAIEERAYWLRQGLRLFCYVFPRDPAILSSPVKGSLWTVLENLLRGHAEACEQIPSTNEVIETLLMVSKSGPLARRRLILSRIDQILDKTVSVHLHAELVYQQSVVLRLKGDIRGSQLLLQKFLDCAETAQQLRSLPHLGFLHLSQSANHVYNSDFASAEKEVKKWAPQGTKDPGKELGIVWSQIISAGRIMRGQGNFRTACLFFEHCWKSTPLRESQRHLALSHLMDTYVEVDYEDRRQIYSESAGELLENAVRLNARTGLDSEQGCHIKPCRATCMCTKHGIRPHGLTR